MGQLCIRKLFSSKGKRKKIFSVFEGVGSYATVWVNNKRAGYHAGGRTTFTLDVTLTSIRKKMICWFVLIIRLTFCDLPWVCGGCSDERGFSEGSQPLGIFRPVSLLITKVRIQPFGIP